jgi:hypothetical protein
MISGGVASMTIESVRPALLSSAMGSSLHRERAPQGQAHWRGSIYLA